MRASRLAIKIYVFSLFSVVVCLALFAAFVLLVIRYREDPFYRINRNVVENLAICRSDSMILGRSVEAMRSQPRPMLLSLYDTSGQLITSTVTPPLPMITAEELRQLESGRPTMFQSGREVYPIMENGVLACVGILIVDPLPLEKLFSPFVMVLVVLLAVALGFAGHLVKPLQKITRAARRFGSGELDARVAIQRSDEIGEVGRAFDDMADRVTGLMSAQQEMMANVSHELRTPMARMKVATELLQEGLGDSARDLLPEIERDLGELERLLDDVMALAHLDLARFDRSSTVTLRRENVSVAELLEKAATSFNSRQTTHKPSVDAAATLPIIKADPVLLRRVIENLLDNARKYSAPGAAILLTATDSPDGVTITVADEGIGIDEADIEKVFIPFFRTDRSRSRATGGVGLGLALAQRVVEAHDGHISLSSKAGKGTTVTITLPPGPRMR